MHFRFSTRLTFDDDLFKVLLPLKDAWREGLVNTPRNFTSLSIFEQAFSELLLCKGMYYHTTVVGPLRQPFLSLPALRECTSLRIFRPPSPLTALEVRQWLNMDSHSMESKRLEMGDDGLTGSVENLVHHLKNVCVGRDEDICLVGNGGRTDTPAESQADSLNFVSVIGLGECLHPKKRGGGYP